MPSFEDRDRDIKREDPRDENQASRGIGPSGSREAE